MVALSTWLKLELHHQCIICEAYLESFTSQMADISRIPPEILGEIFIRCLPVHFSLQSQNPQQLLSSVCRLWRTLVLDTPALWASLIITYDAGGLHPPLPVIRTHLQRSGTHPLSFMLFTSENTHSDLLSVLTMLTAARQRWENVEIILPTMTQDTLALIIQGDAPLLRSIQCQIIKAPWGLPIPLCMLDCCPRLESFQWSSPGSPLLLPFANTSLTSLSLGTSLCASECIAVLRLSPRLSSAMFHVAHSSIRSATFRLTHPALCTLTLAGGYFNMLLAALTLPALLDLDIMTEDTSIPFPQWEIVLPAFLERSTLTLRRLSLSLGCMPLAWVIVRILTLTPHLHSLKLGRSPYSSPLTPALIRALHPQSPPNTPLCPRLRILELSGASELPDGLYTEMLRARWGANAHVNGVACLKCAHITLRGGVHDRDRVDVEELCAEGMRATISWSEGDGPR